MRQAKSITALSAVTTGTSNAYAINDMDRVGLTCQWASGVTAGVVVLEAAPAQDYTGTWNALVTLNVTGAGTPPSIQASAVEVVGLFVRARVTTTVSGGGSPSVTAIIDMSRRS